METTVDIPDYTKTDRTLLSLFDYTGEWSKPFEDAGWNVIHWDLQLGEEMDINNIESAEYALDRFGSVDGILAAAPCTDFCSSGARWWAGKDASGQTTMSIQLVNQVLKLVDLFTPTDPDYEGTWFWSIENPVGRISKLVPEVGKPFYFQPYQFAGYLKWIGPSELNRLNEIRKKEGIDITSSEAEFILKTNTYTKKTGLWGNYNVPVEKSIPPVKGSPQGSVLQRLGGKSLKTKNIRSATPAGFAQAFYQANKNRVWDMDQEYWNEYYFDIDKIQTKDAILQANEAKGVKKDKEFRALEKLRLKQMELDKFKLND